MRDKDVRVAWNEFSVVLIEYEKVRTSHFKELAANKKATIQEAADNVDDRIAKLIGRAEMLLGANECHPEPVIVDHNQRVTT